MTLEKFWRESLPGILSRYFEFGCGVGGAEFRPRDGKLQLKEVKALESGAGGTTPSSQAQAAELRGLADRLPPAKGGKQYTPREVQDMMTNEKSAMIAFLTMTCLSEIVP